MTEELIHRHVVAHLRRARVVFFHVPNEGKRGPKARAALHGLGVMPGIPDIVIVTPPPKVRGTFTTTSGDVLDVGKFGAVLELKADKGRATPEQKQWLETFAAHGWATALTHGLDAALGQLRAWGYIE